MLTNLPRSQVAEPGLKQFLGIGSSLELTPGSSLELTPELMIFWKQGGLKKPGGKCESPFGAFSQGWLGSV